MSRFFIGLSLVLISLFFQKQLKAESHDPGVVDTRASTKEKRPEGSTRAASSVLRAALISCAEKMGALQPSKDYADFMVDQKGKAYVNLFHESGTYIVPLDAEKLEKGSYQALISFPTNPNRKEKILLTVSIADVKKLEGITVRTTVPVVQDQNPNGLDTLNAISGILKEEDVKDAASENHWLDTRLVPNVGTDIQTRATAVATRVPKLDTIFADVNFRLDLQKAVEAATKARGIDKTQKEFEADLKERFAEVYNKFDKEGRFKEETQKAMDKLAKEMSEMLAALKVCAKTPEKTISKLSNDLALRMSLPIEAHAELQKTFASHIATRIKGMNEKKYNTIDAETLKVIQSSIAEGIEAAYVTARNKSQEEIQKKRP